MIKISKNETGQFQANIKDRHISAWFDKYNDALDWITCILNGQYESQLPTTKVVGL